LSNFYVTVENPLRLRVFAVKKEGLNAESERLWLVMDI